MLAITLGFTANGRTAQPTVLYAGLDADAARVALENPPPGIIRTGMVRNPVVNPVRHFPENIAPAPIEEPPAKAPKPSKPKEPAIAPDLLPESND